ncbi:ATP-binding protein [Methanosphaera sp. WGK6]|uniref:AAA family ATPase n=1 Tax=Methanosphaera sp. WGK6 TaxID=1561964 RepID=UPI00084BE78C|nr:ATP-binding protein [Methanosphaera sp. WGK6]OED30408.1 ATPase [Methanosphaera sp. WGK6]
MMPTSVPKNIDKYFYNRKKDIKRISLQINSIYEDLSNQILITGTRGVGKTFLLKKILKDQPDDILTIYIDLSRIYGENQGKISEEEVLKELLSSIEAKINEDKTQPQKIEQTIKNKLNTLKLKNYDFKDATTILNIPLPEIRDNYQELSKFVMELPQSIVDSTEDIKGFIIVMDEFQLLKNLSNPEAFFWLIRSFVQEQSNVSYIFTGSVSKTAEVIEMLNGQTGAFGGRMIQIHIDPFTKEETLNYINDKSDNIRFTSDGFERFYKCTRGIPAYINTFCNILNPGEEYDSDMIKESFLLQMDQIVVMWLYVWGTLNKSEKHIVKILVDEDKLTWNELLDASGYSKATLTKYIDSLNNKGILDYGFDKKYTINDIMLKTWLRNKKEVEGQYPL